MNDFTMTLPSPVLFVLERLTLAGKTAYCVGGCVRDALMGKNPSDYDVTTSAKPDEMLAIFADCRVVETGLKHGTLTVVRDGMNIEITTYRIDGVYGDGRHPESVTFTDRLSDDLCRRDFTVNAMAYSPDTGLVDLYGGRDDLNDHVIRCVGNAKDRFGEDGLRILRALRFSSVLGFRPDSDCSSGVRELTPLLDKISRERIYVEMTKLLTGKNAAVILKDFPETVAFSLGIETDDVLRAAKQIEKDNMPDVLMRYAWLLASYPARDGIERFDRLNPSRAERREVLCYLSHREARLPDEYAVKVLISKTDDDFPARLAHFLCLLDEISAHEEERIVACVHKILANNDCRSLAQLAVSGDDLLAFGFQGKEIGRTLNAMLDAVMRGSVSNNKEDLMKFLQNMSK